RPDHQVRGLPGPAVDHVTAGLLDELDGLAARQGREGAGDDVHLACQRALTLRGGGLFEVETELVEPLEKLAVLRFIEEARHGLRDRLADPSDGPDLFDR